MSATKIDQPIIVIAMSQTIGGYTIYIYGQTKCHLNKSGMASKYIAFWWQWHEARKAMAATAPR